MNNDANNNGRHSTLEMLIEKFKSFDSEFMDFFEKEYPNLSAKDKLGFLDFLNVDASSVNEMLIRSINQRAFAKAA